MLMNIMKTNKCCRNRPVFTATIKSNLVLQLDSLCWSCQQTVALKRVRFDLNPQDPTSAAASFGHNVEESSCVIHLGQCVGFPLGSACLGLCNEDFPDHRAKPHDNNNNLTTGDFIRKEA